MAYVDGTHSFTIRAHRAISPGPARQCKHFDAAGAQCYSVRGRARLQMASTAEGNWHTVRGRMNRWSKNGVLDRVSEYLQREQIVRVKIEAVWIG